MIYDFTRPNGSYFHGLLAEPDCADCPLRYDTKVFPDGPIPARLAIIGEEPGCLPPDSYVRDEDGLSKIDNPSLADTETVRILCGSHEGLLYTVHALGMPMTTTPNHLIFYRTSGLTRNKRWKMLDETMEIQANRLTKNGRNYVVATKRYLRGEDTPDPDLATKLGLLMAAGRFVDGKVLLNLIRIKNIAELRLPLREYDGSWSTHILNDSKFAELVDSNCIGENAELLLPSIVWNSTSGFVKALFKTWHDNTVSEEGDFILGSRALLGQCFDLLSRLGIIPAIRTIRWNKGVPVAWRANITDAQREHLGWPRREHKVSKVAYKEDEENFYIPISDVSCKKYSGPVFDRKTEAGTYNAPFLVHNSTELTVGRGFSGPSGMLLWQICESVGIRREECWVTNASLCRARNVTLSNKAKLKKQMVKAMAAKACRERLLKELSIVDPIVAIPVGNWALWSISDLPDAKIFGYRGSRLEIDPSVLLKLVESGIARSGMRRVKEAF